MSAARAAAGDFTAAILHVDSMLHRISGTSHPVPDGLDGPLITSPADASALLDAYCTLLYLFITAFRKACEATGKDVHAETIPTIIGTLRLMTTIEPEAIPAMAAMMTAAAMDLSPTLWRQQYGPWQPEEIIALERTVLALASEINTAHGRDDAAPAHDHGHHGHSRRRARPVGDRGRPANSSACPPGWPCRRGQQTAPAGRRCLGRKQAWIEGMRAEARAVPHPVTATALS